MESMFSTCSYCGPDGCYTGVCPFASDVSNRSDEDAFADSVVADVLLATGRYDINKVRMIKWSELSFDQTEMALEMCSVTTTTSDH